MEKLLKLFGNLLVIGILFRILLSLFNPILFLVFIGLILGIVGRIFKTAGMVTRKKEYRRERKYSIQEYAQLNDYLKKWFRYGETLQMDHVCIEGFD